MAKSKAGGGGLGKLLLGFVLGLVTVAVGGWAYLKYAELPVATADKPFPWEDKIVSVPLDARIARQMKTPPFGTGEDVYEKGASIYRTQCSVCHGTPSHDVAFAKDMYPPAPQLWKKHGKSKIIGVSDDDEGETYWKVANGIRLTGMPAFNHVLSDTEMWDVTLLLKNADQDLPDPVMRILTTP